MSRYDFILPLRTVSRLNAREHWRVRQERSKAERTTAAMMCPHFPVPCVVTLTRVGPRALDSDNLQGALKSIRDGIADRLKVNDNGPLVDWRYAQERGPYAVRVLLEEPLSRGKDTK